MDLFSDTSSILVASTTRNTARTLPQSSGYLLQRGSFCFIGQIDQHRDLLLVHDDLIHKQLQDLLRALCLYFQQTVISIHSLRMEGDSKTAQESVFHFAYPCTILQKRMQKTTFCTRKNGFFRKKGEKFGAKPSASFCAPMIRTDTFPLNFSHRISGSSMSMVSFAPICSTFD